MGNQIQQYLKEHGYNTASDMTYTHISEWLEWYQGDVEAFHKYKIYNGTTMTTHNRYRMGMAKKICEDWASLILNEKVAIKAGTHTELLDSILEYNNFKIRGNQLIELAFALGTGAFVEYLDADENIVIDYIRADMMYPLSWDNGDVTECAFGSVRVLSGKEVIYLQIHRKGREDGENASEYYIENKYVDAESGAEIECPEDVEPIIGTGSSRPLFQIITPNICNNIDLDSPLGISVYANCIDQLKGCDLIYDSYINEFVLGRKRILVPLSFAKMEMQKDGGTAPVFDPNDTVYYMMPGDRASDMKLTEVDMTIRANEHELGIQRSLDLMSLKVGMGNRRYKFDAGGVKTATEVISDKSDLYQSLCKHKIIVRTALINMSKAVLYLSKQSEDAEVTVDFDDSIIEDSNAIIDKNIKLVTGGLRSKLTAIMEICNCSQSEAEKEMKIIADEGQITGQDIDWTDDDSDDLEGNADKAGDEVNEPT